MNEGDTRAFMRPFGLARPQRERTIYRGFAVPFREEMNVCELLDIGRPERPDCVHRWRIAEQGQAVDHVFPALCSKCGAQRSYSATLEVDFSNGEDSAWRRRHGYGVAS